MTAKELIGNAGAGLLWAGVGCLPLLGLLGLWFGITALMALGVQYVLGVFGVHVGFWVCWVGWILITALLRIANGGSKE